MSSIPMRRVPAALRRRSVTLTIDQTDAVSDERFQLHRQLGRLDLIAMGVGSVVGAGIFVSVGVAAATKAGPAIIVSFVLAGIISALTALCYAELAAMVPLTGSAFTFAYVTLGEIVAFIVGWDLLLEFVVSGSVVALGWAGLFTAALDSLLGISLPHAITAPASEGGVVNLPAVLSVAALVVVLVRGVKMTARSTAVLVTITIAALLLVIAVGIRHVQPANWAPFAPFGVNGIAAGAAIAFFAYAGFDIVASTAEESVRPQRDVPFALLATVVISSVLYIAVGAVLTGVTPYSTLDNEAPVATALAGVGEGWIGNVILVASVVALTKGVLMMLYAQTRLAFAMCRDGLLPRSFAVTHPRWGTPARLTVPLGLLTAAIAAFLPIDIVIQLVNIGALVAFTIVAVGVICLRWLEPDRERPFRVPLVPLLPLLAIAGCVWLATTLTALTWLRFGVWMMLGVAVYALYGVRHSVMSGAR